MNKITTEILTFLLKKEEYWDKKTGKVEREKAIHSLLLAREALWFDRIYFPLLSLVSWVYKTCHAPLCVTGETGKEVALYIEDWYQQTVLCNGEELSFWRPVDELYAEILDDHLHEALEQIWYNHSDWIYEEPSEEEMLALGVNPGNIAAQQLLVTGVEVKKKQPAPKAPVPRKEPKEETKATQGSLW